MTDQWMLLTLPSSGSDWLCRLIAEHCPTLSYFDKEWFNPICNLEHELTLGNAFGCEMPTYVDRIAAPVSDSALERVYEDTWEYHAVGRFNFDKEVYSFAMVPFFAKRFQTAILDRGPHDTFPPTRLRVWSWYDAIGKSLENAGVRFAPRDIPIRHRAPAAHQAASMQMLHDADECGVPVIEYAVLMYGDMPRIRKQIAPWLKDHLTADLIEAIIETRRPRPSSAV